MKGLYVIILAIIVLSFEACDSKKIIEHQSGLMYRFVIQNTDSMKPIKTDIVVLDMSYTTMNDSLIDASDYFRMQINEPTHSGGSIEDALLLMHKGDSATFIIDAYSFYTKTRKTQLPKFFKPGDEMKFHIKLIDIMKFKDFEQERKTIRSSNQDEEMNLLRTYLKRMNVDKEATNSGLYIFNLRKGTGNTPIPGNKITVDYLGYFIDGKMFDNSYERGEPFVFTYGIGQVIQGWEEGLAGIKEGGKVKLIIPSYLAYGDKKVGPIPPYSTLVFEIELIKADQ